MTGLRFADCAGGILTEKGDCSRLRTSPLRCSDCAAAVVVAASGAADHRLVRICFGRIVAMMRALTPAAGMLWRDGGLQRGRKNRSDQRK
jgi:hypothetical protein